MAVYIDSELCKSCKLCATVCPRGVFELTGKVNKKGYEYMGAPNVDKCIMCMLCEKSCPDFAIHVEKDTRSA